MGAATNLRGRSLRTSTLVAVIFFCVCGGPFGLEDAVRQSGPGVTLLLLILIPLFWSLPVALVTAELSSALPAEGGVYAWVERAFGPFWGFQEGWFSWAASLADMTLFVSLFIAYLSYWFPSLTAAVPAGRMLALAFIWSLTALNLSGTRRVGESALASAALVLAPFAVAMALGLAHWRHAPWAPFTAPASGGSAAAMGAGFMVVFWNYTGWELAATCGDEVDRAASAYPRALAIATPLITLTYLLPTAAGLTGALAWNRWTTGALPVVADHLGGPWLGNWVAAAAVVSSAGLFGASLLAFSRVPFAMAARGQLPAALARVSERTGVPWVAVVASSAIYSVIAGQSFLGLAAASVLLHSVTLSVECLAAQRLRKAEPRLPRPAAVPGGRAGLGLAVWTPICISLAALSYKAYGEALAHGAAAIVVPAAILLSGPLAYAAWGRKPRASEVNL